MPESPRSRARRINRKHPKREHGIAHRLDTHSGQGAGVLTRAIVRIDLEELPYIDIERCYDCRLCIPACPFDALRVVGDIRLSVNIIS